MAGENGHRIALITDSTCDIPQPLLEQYDIHLVPQYLIWGTEEFRDRIDVSADEFYRRLSHSTEFPRSSQPVIGDFFATLQAAQAAGAEEAVIVTISSGLSGTIKSAQQAAVMADMPVHIHDSRTSGMALGWQVLAAARAREAGGDAGAMLDVAARARDTMQIIFTVDSLEHLHRNGRIGRASHLIGSALNIKPVLWVDHSAGVVEAADRVRTHKRALERVYQLYFEHMDTSRPMHVAVIHSIAPDLAAAFEGRVRAEYDPVELLVTPISPVVGAHVGPNGVGLAGYYERE